MNGTSLLVASSKPSSTAANPAWTSAFRAWSRTLSPNGPTTVTRGLLSAVSTGGLHGLSIGRCHHSSQRIRSPFDHPCRPPVQYGRYWITTGMFFDHLIRVDIYVLVQRRARHGDGRPRRAPGTPVAGTCPGQRSNPFAASLP